MDRKYFKLSHFADLYEIFQVPYQNGSYILLAPRNKEIVQETLPLLEIEKTKPSFESSFYDWNGASTVSLKDFSKTAAPLTIGGYRGDFKFTRIPEGIGNIIRASPLKRGKNGKMVVQLGYTPGKNGFDLKILPDQLVTFIIHARVSSIAKMPTQLFIQDKVEKWKVKSVIIHGKEWRKYRIKKRIREGAKQIRLGISWTPDSFDDWLEIKETRIFVQ